MSAEPLARWATPIASVLLTTVALELATRAGWLSREVLPPPTAIVAELPAAFADGTAPRLFLSTLQGWGVGLAAAAVVGVALGLAIGSFRTLERFVSGVLEFVRPIPSVALIPLCVIMFGIGMDTKYVLVFLASLWPFVIHAALGTRSVDAVASDTVRTFGVSRLGRIRHLLLPSLAAQVFTGLRIASAIALIVAITVELIVGAPGLGNQVNIAQQANNLEQMWAYILLIGLLGLAVNTAFQRLEGTALHWHASQRMETP